MLEKVQSFFKHFNPKQKSSNSESLTHPEDEEDSEVPQKIKKNQVENKNLHQLPNPLFAMTPEDKKELELVLRENNLRDYCLTF